MDTRTSSTFVRRLSLVLLTLALTLPPLSGCGLLGEEAKKAAETAGDLAVLAVLPPQEEEAMGKEMNAKIESSGEFQLLPENEKYSGVHQYVDQLGETAVASAEKVNSSQTNATMAPIEFNFHVIDAPGTVNAFAIAGGEIYVYSGLLLEAESKSEVMSVISHEVAHVTERHVAKQMLAVKGIEAFSEKAKKRFGKAADGKNSQLLTDYVAAIAKKGAIAAYGKSQENQADKKGVAYMSEAGYDPNGFVSFFNRLAEKSDGGSSLKRIFASHPAPKERIEEVEKLIEDEGYSGSTVGKQGHSDAIKPLQ